MATTTADARFSPEEFGRLGDEIFERSVLPHTGPDDHGKFAVIDVTSGDYEIDADELTASDRLLSRRPAAQIWLRRVGFPYARRFGRRHKPVAA
jgi:hypothetical protein